MRRIRGVEYMINCDLRARDDIKRIFINICYWEIDDKQCFDTMCSICDELEGRGINEAEIIFVITKTISAEELIDVLGYFYKYLNRTVVIEIDRYSITDIAEFIEYQEDNDITVQFVFSGDKHLQMFKDVKDFITSHDSDDNYRTSDIIIEEKYEVAKLGIYISKHAKTFGKETKPLHYLEPQNAIRFISHIIDNAKVIYNINNSDILRKPCSIPFDSITVDSYGIYGTCPFIRRRGNGYMMDRNYLQVSDINIEKYFDNYLYKNRHLMTMEGARSNILACNECYRDEDSDISKFDSDNVKKE